MTARAGKPAKLGPEAILAGLAALVSVGTGIGLGRVRGTARVCRDVELVRGSASGACGVTD